MVRVFAYGTLRPSLYPRVEKVFNLKKVGDGTLRGPFQMLHLGGFPGVIHDYKLKISTMVGEVVEVVDLNQLDSYEGYRADGEGLYDRKEVAVKLTDGTTVQCWVYLFNKPKDTQATKFKYDSIPEGDWAKR